MNIAALLLNQIAIMFILMAIGYGLYKLKFISDQGSKDIGKILLYLVIPIVIVNNFMIDLNAENVEALIHSTVISFICMVIAMIISYIFFGKRDGIANFSSTFSNAGFIGIPLVQATLGANAVFYISIMIVMINVLQWTYGVFIITGDSSVMSLKKIVTNPIVIAVILGLLVFLLQIRFPSTIMSVCSNITGLNTPLAMIVSGVYLAQSDLKAMLVNKKIYLVSMMRLIVIPLITVCVFKFLPFGNETLKLAILITAACPVGSNVAIFAQAYDADYHSAVEQVCMTTILCLLTLPLIIYAATAII